MATSLQHALADSALPHDEWEKRYGAFLALTARLLGSAPNFSATVHSSELTIRFYFGALRSCLRIPFCDLGFGRISAPQRRLILVEGSLRQGCMYCATHCAAVGDVLRGSALDQCVMDGGLRSRNNESASDRLLKKIVQEACRFPGVIENSTKIAFVKEFGEEGYLELASMLCFMGWLNWMMDAFGMRIESAMVPFAEATLKDASVEYVTDGAVAEDGQRGVGEKQLERALTPSFWHRIAAYVRNAADLIGLVRHIVVAGYYETMWFRGIPSTKNALDLLTATELGYLPKFVAAVDDITLKRALVFGLRDILFRDSLTSWTRREKFLYMFIFSKGVGNGVLEEDCTRLIEVLDSRVCVESKSCNYGGADSVSERSVPLAQELKELLFKTKDELQPPHDKFSAGCEFVAACSGRATGLNEFVVGNLLRYAPERKDTIDLSGLVAMCGFIHRAVVFNC